MLKSNILIHVFGVLSILITLFGLINFTSKFIFGYDENITTTNIKATTSHVYDPDMNLNFSLICLFSKQPHKIPYEKTTCHNKTLIHWYVPWIRYDVWKNFWKEIKMKNEMENMGKKMESNDTENNETKLNTVEEYTSMTSTPIPNMEKLTNKEKGKSSVVVTILVDCGSLADFTLNRHIRRESQVQGSHLQRQASFDIPSSSKVTTKTLLHQSSLDRDYPNMISEVKSEEVRRNSVPSYLINESLNAGKINFNSSSQFSPFHKTFRRQQSIDMSNENLNSDVRKKPRHFIRRH
ncbi:hypothetical protein Phum_PHUM614300 [Pediculus humanus corporis]|uniref:Uncharacterized protein n=1 Tax=Pediculus humanus subsp. corporis TaxID=121224 RepID=E0W422_PEDHC|nr:uncharacterized protein Phum_PHUM614300 [Pediculus humanus corporis]EEB20378.1 hypothetical protein Phum_PHUM614300 [Pediculus humanus corporis]